MQLVRNIVLMKHKETINKLLVRVYAIIFHQNSILLTDEFWHGTLMTKFPGGALIPGESVINCLKREIQEELNTSIVSYKHLYTCEKFIVSQFSSNTQILPIYYLTKLKDYSTFRTSQNRYDFDQLTEGSISIRWIQVNQITEHELTFETDRIALKIFLEQIQTLKNDTKNTNI